VFSNTLQHFSLAITARWLHSAVAAGWLRLEPGDGAGIWTDEVEAVLQRLGPEPLGPEPARTDDLVAGLWSAHEQCLHEGDTVALRWFALSRRLGLSLEERSTLAFLVGASNDLSVARLVRYAWADLSRRVPPQGFLHRALALGQGGTDAVVDRWVEATRRQSPLRRAGLLALEDHEVLGAERGVAIDESVVDWLSGRVFEGPGLIGFEVGEPPARLRKALSSKLRALSSHGATQVAIVGPKSSGRLAVAGQIARALAPEAGLFQVDLGSAVGQGTLRDELAEARLASVLMSAVVVLTGFDDLEHPEAAIEATHRAFDRLPIPRVWITRSPDVGALRVPPSQVVSIGYPTRAQRVETWTLLLGDRPQLAVQMAGGFLLSERQIALAVEEATARSESKEPSEEALILAARAQAATGLGTLAQPEETKVDLEQIVLGAETRTMIDEMLAYSRHRDELVGDWGFGDTLSYGLGVTALYVGPPGTGKTLAATAIAKALGQELYRVDLAQLVSKYIGETEKHLGAVFDAAQQGEVMLLFDEADSLFGKRTEVKSSVDRYANLEVNYLLQRVERFEGVVVLTTNHEKGIDEAFARRIRFRVAFDDPDATARRHLWRALLPAQVPLAADVDLDLLAERYELSGGHIKEVALRAASLAKAAGTAVQQRHLLRSAEAEYRKLGKLSLAERETTFEDDGI